MKIRFILPFLIFITLPLLADEALEYGVEPGLFTQDYEAALQYAEDNNLAVLLNFTGSDWCGWCQLMDRQVFSKNSWKDYAEANMVLISLDFPQNAAIVPEEFRPRNQELQRKFGVTGYPTYILLDSDGSTELGRLGASQDKTPEIFIEENKKLLRFSLSYMETFQRNLEGSLKKQLEEVTSEIRSSGTDLAPERRRSLNSQASRIYEEYIFSKLNSGDTERYQSAQQDLQAANAELDRWLQTKPQRNDANNKIYGDFVNRISNAREILDGIQSRFF